MEGFMNLFIQEETHGMKVKRHLNWDDMNWIAITPAGSVVIYRDRTDWMVYAVYVNHRGRYHIHMPYGEDMVIFDERAKRVLEEVHLCLQHADCYIYNNMIYNINPLRMRTNQPFGFPPWRSNLLRITTPPFPHAKSKYELHKR